MTDTIVPQLTARFDELSQRLPDEGIEFWFARDLMEPPGLRPLGELHYGHSSGYRVL